MDHRDKQMLARKIRREADRNLGQANAIAFDGDVGGPELTPADVKYAVHQNVGVALARIALDLQENLPR